MSRFTFKSTSSNAHEALNALSELIISIDQQGSRLGLCLTSHSLKTHCKPTFRSLTLCEVLSCWRQRKISTWLPGSPEPRGEVSVSSPSSMGSHQSKTMWNQIISSCKPSTANKPIAVILLIQAAFLKANLRKSSIQQLFKELISESFPRSFFVSSQHLPGRYHVTTTQQPAPIAQ